MDLEEKQTETAVVTDGRPELSLLLPVHGAAPYLRAAIDARAQQRRERALVQARDALKGAFGSDSGEGD